MVERLWDFHWQTFSGETVRTSPDLIAECLDLFGAHYGVWGGLHPRRGERIALPEKHFVDMFESDESLLACAYHEGDLVGYCVAVFTDREIVATRIAWVSQLVVHTDFRHQKIATRLLFSIWQFTDCWAWGLVTSNPLAVRALEAATRRPVDRERIVSGGDGVINALEGRVPYLPPRLKRDSRDEPLPVVFTEFMVSHYEVDSLLRAAERTERPWSLGSIIDGDEWMACTFGDQHPDVLSDERLEEIFVGADRIWMDAYSRMSLDSDHAWRKFARDEARYVVDSLGLPAGSRMLDVGCGDGRHSAAFAECGMSVHAVEIVPSLVNKAAMNTHGLDVEVEQLDLRHRVAKGDHDCAVMLYDVVGSSPAADDSEALLRHVRDSLNPGSPVVMSVMNAKPTLEALDDSHKPKTRDEFLVALENLPATGTMESTGNVFDPNSILYFNGVFYRKEQFAGEGAHLPCEYVIRDSRFTVASITRLCERAGLNVSSVKPVRLGRWSAAELVDEADPRAKELLVHAVVPSR